MKKIGLNNQKYITKYSIIFLLTQLVFFSSPLSLANSEDKISLIKAGIISKFPNFVHWPKNSNCEKSKRINILSYGDSPVANQLQRLYPLLKKRHSGLVTIDSVKNLEQIPFCSFLFIGAEKKDSLREIKKISKDRHVFTISDSKDYIKHGVLINLYEEKGKVRFEYSEKTLLKSDFSMSYKLLKLARKVK